MSLGSNIDSPCLYLSGAQTSFTFALPNHKLCFQSKVSPVDMSTMPPTASLTLPPVTMSGEYIMEDHESYSDQGWAPDDFPAKPGNYLQGNYLRCVAEVSGAASVMPHDQHGQSLTFFFLFVSFFSSFCPFFFFLLLLSSVFLQPPLPLFHFLLPFSLSSSSCIFLIL